MNPQQASSETFLDTAAEAREVRAEDSFEVGALTEWLRTHVGGLPEGSPAVRQFPGGASNLTYLLDYGAGHDLVLRTPPRGTKAASAHNMHREYEVQRRLRPQFPKVPHVLAYADAQTSPIGAEFYVMERADGVIPRADLPPAVVRSADEAGLPVGQLGNALFDLLAGLHSVDVTATGLDAYYRGPGYVGRQVNGWSERYRAARTADSPDGEAVMEWLAINQPEDVGVCMVHGDWRFDNVVLNPLTLVPVAVLDWELATVGDPLMDLGAALAYWVEPGDDAFFQGFRRQPSNAPGMPTRAQIVERYLARSGRGSVDWTFYEVYGLFRLAVIVQQIWFRYQAGQTSNPAFRQFGAAVDYLMWRCGARIG